MARPSPPRRKLKLSYVEESDKLNWQWGSVILNTALIDLARRILIKPDLSPLRYPGGKRKLVPLLIDLIGRSDAHFELLIEPFAGGAAVSVALLEADVVGRIALADADPLVAAFWSVVFSAQAGKLADKIYDTPVTIEEWTKQKSCEPKDIVGQAFKCFFLNRTSFSGSLARQAGPIGGRSQSGPNRIDCRYNSGRLAERIVQLSGLRRRVDFVRCQSWQMTVAQIRSRRVARHSPKDLLWYLDPPFFENADRLYRYYFTRSQHEDLASQLECLPGHWVLSYDDRPTARSLYAANAGFATVNLQYTARVDDGRRTVASEILVSSLIALLRSRKAIARRVRQLPCPRSISTQSHLGQVRAFGTGVK